jgi:tetratricopeptide (TPR) repeat protein
MRQVAGDVDAQIDFAEYAFSVHAPFTNMVDLSRAGAAQRERFLGIFDNYCSHETIDIGILTDRELQKRCCAIQVRVIEDNIDKSTDKAFSYRCLADLYLVQGAVDKAIENYRKGLEIDRRDSAAHFNLGLVLSRQGRLDEAIAQIDEAVQIRPAFKLRAQRSLGRILSAERPERAAREYEQYLALEPDDAQVHNELGKVLGRLGRLDSAIEHFREAVRLKPDFAEALENLRYAQAQRQKLSGQSR